MKAQRIHYNYLEGVMQVITGIAISGLYNPLVSSIWGILYNLSRIWFNVGYKIAPSKRMMGVPIIMITNFFLPIWTIYSMVQFARSG